MFIDGRGNDKAAEAFVVGREVRPASSERDAQGTSADDQSGEMLPVRPGEGKGCKEVGTWRMAARVVSPRTRDGKQLPATPLEEFALRLRDEAKMPAFASSSGRPALQ